MIYILSNKFIQICNQESTDELTGGDESKCSSKDARDVLERVSYSVFFKVFEYLDWQLRLFMCCTIQYNHDRSFYSWMVRIHNSPIILEMEVPVNYSSKSVLVFMYPLILVYDIYLYLALRVSCTYTYNRKKYIE